MESEGLHPVSLPVKIDICRYLFPQIAVFTHQAGLLAFRSSY